MGIEFAILFITIVVILNGAKATVTVISKHDETFLSLQTKAVQAYIKSQPVQKEFRCSYQDIMTAQSSIPILPNEEMYFEILESKIEHVSSEVSKGASEVALVVQNGDAGLVLLWEGVFVVSLDYYNVLYGKNKTLHVGFGVSIPEAFYAVENESLMYYDLVKCIPFTEWVRLSTNVEAKNIFLVPSQSRIELRNLVHGVTAMTNSMLDLWKTSTSTLEPPSVVDVKNN